MNWSFLAYLVVDTSGFAEVLRVRKSTSLVAMAGIKEFLSPILGLGVNIFANRFIHRMPPLGVSARPLL